VPSGTVTFLFTDIEESTRLWDERPEAMRQALARHDELLHSAIEAHDGYIFSAAGDGVAAAFQRSADGVAAAVDAQRALVAEPWPEGALLRVRMGLHTGEAEERDGNYFGAPVNRAARLMAAAHGRQIVMSDATTAVLGQISGIGLIDLGSHRLRGLVESTRVFGVKADGLDWVEVPLATPEGTPGNLPHPPTEWFGPLAELNRRATEIGRRRLVTLTGPGGVGKTRLAVEIGSLVAGDFHDGVWMVELAPVADPDAVHAAVAATLGVLPQEGMRPLDAILDWLEGRRLLLLIDNCEHVLRSAVELVQAVVGACDTVTVIATTREPLGVPGEQVVPVPSLAAMDAVELFCDRARLADVSTEFSDGDRETVAAICQRLDGIPLAIELAAARSRSLTLAELLDRLADRFKVLRGGGRGGTERHQTLRATVAWSYQLLSEDERLLFDRLSVFAGTFDSSAAEAVCCGDAIDTVDVFDLVCSLVDKSLVVVDRTGHTTRYRLLETLRQYGEERLGERAATAAVRARHLAHYVTVAERAAAWWASPQETEGDELFRQEWDNLRAAHATAIDNGDLFRAEAILTATFMGAASLVRSEYIDWADRTISLATSDVHLNPRTYGRAASLAWLIGDNEKAIEIAHRGIAEAEHAEHPDTLECWATPSLALVYTGRFDALQDAVAHLERVLNTTTDPWATWTGWNALALISIVLPDQALLERRVEAAFAAAEALGAPGPRAVEAYLRAYTLQMRDPPDRSGAVAWYRRSLELARTTGSEGSVGASLMWLAIGSALFELEEADAVCRDGVALAYQMRFGAALWPTVCHTAVHFIRREWTECAAVVVGHLRTHHPGVPLMCAAILREDPFACLSGPELAEWRAKGAAMDRAELVKYILDQLGSVDAQG
jgi:predicted ATPase/class 3 adenylate cyclase